MNPLTFEGLLGPNRVGVVGDLHGNYPWTMNVLNHLHQHDIHTIVQVGDFGYWPETNGGRKFLYKLDKQLAERGQMLLWVDGNHESHPRLLRTPIDVETGLRPITECIHHIPRGFRWEWHSKTWMGVGGAHSVDRQWRKQGFDWFPEEYLTDAEVAYASRTGKVDVMVCHDAPDGANVPCLAGGDGGAWIPMGDRIRSRKHRELIRIIVDEVRPELLIHGHYHDPSYEHLMPRGRGRSAGRTLVVGLSEDGTSIERNVRIVDLLETST